MASLVERIKEWKNRKPKAVRLAEAVFELLPDEEWASMKSEYGPAGEDVRDWILKLAWESTCVYSMKKSMLIAALKLTEIKRLYRWAARVEVYEMFLWELYKNPANRRTFASYFC